MSYQQEGNYADREPLSKKQKRGDGDEKPKADEIIAFGGPMYDEATARKMLEEVVLVIESEFHRAPAVIGFDPNDAALDNVYYIDDYYWKGVEITPMIYFAHKGDVKMCRYLLSRGASTTNVHDSVESCNFYFPMFTAAREGHLEVCKFLYANGASHDIRKENFAGWTPFHTALFDGHDELVRWLVLQGALCANANSEEIKGDRIFPEVFERRVSNRVSSHCERLVEWAEEVTQTHSSLATFLLGTQPRSPDKDQNRTLQWLSGHPGVRKNIGDFVMEVTKGKQLRILRNVVDVLPSLIKAEDEE